MNRTEQVLLVGVPTETVELPIPAGQAQATVVAAMANLVAAVVAFEKVAMAVARQLDESTKEARR